MKTVNVIGAGLIGEERFRAVAKLLERGLPVQLASVYDPFNPQIGNLAVRYGFRVAPDLSDILSTPADLLIIACPHDLATEYACTALTAGHRVLLEKPAGRNLEETRRIAAAASKGNGFFLGLNYRFMPGIVALLHDWRTHRFGAPISLRLQIGHGGKAADKKTWKLDPIRCGGGALLDPGIHLLDLSRKFVGTDLDVVALSAWRGFWKTGIEEDVHLLLNAAGTTVSIETSIVHWRSTFEIFALGTDGYGHVTGRGRSYGPQRYKRGHRWGWQDAADQSSSEETVIQDACEDSFADELAACLGFLPKHPSATRPANLCDSIAVMELYHTLRARLGEALCDKKQMNATRENQQVK
jgi:predicted dehydrogenase